MMNNKEKYKTAFDAIKPSDEFTVDLSRQRKLRLRGASRIATAAALALVIFAGGFGTIYAANVGSILQKVHFWIDGMQATGEVTALDNGRYKVEYVDQTGEEHSLTGVTENGGSVSKEELLSEVVASLEDPSLEYTEDERAVFTWYDQTVDITDMFEDGVCYLTLTHEGKTVYITTVEDTYPGAQSPYWYTFNYKEYPSADILLKSVHRTDLE